MTDLINTASGAKLYICATPTPDADTQAEFEALVWVQIKGIESVGRIGRTKKTSTFTALEDGEERIFPGAYQAINLEVVAGKNSSDPGQQEVATAVGTKFRFPMKLELADAPDEDHTNTIKYFHAFALSDQDDIGNDTNVVKVNYTFVTQASSILEIEPTFVTP